MSGAQIGSMTGPLVAAFGAKTLGIPLLTLMVSTALLFVPLLVKMFITAFPQAAS